MWYGAYSLPTSLDWDTRVVMAMATVMATVGSLVVVVADYCAYACEMVQGELPTTRGELEVMCRRRVLRWLQLRLLWLLRCRPPEWLLRERGWFDPIRVVFPPLVLCLRRQW